MKSLFFTAALLLGSTAVVGTATAQSGPGPIIETVVADGSPPERDARGIPVVSGPAVVPPGANQAVPMTAGTQAVPAPNQGAVFQTQASPVEYPICTRTVTDRCVQAYERGVREPS